MQRPERVSVVNEIGKKQSLPAGRNYFEVLPGKGTPVFLGLGPEPSKLPELFPETEQAHYVECPDFFSTSGISKEVIPAEYGEISADKAQQAVRDGSPLIIYKPARRMFPCFWGPIISKVQILRNPTTKAPSPKTIWITGDENSLLVKELMAAACKKGLNCRTVVPEKMRANLLPLLGQETPELILSINFKGIDSYGENYHLLDSTGTKLVVWMVDNPFNILSGLKSKFWHEVPLLVTDSWFIEPLKTHGAKRVEHMPLAADPVLFSPQTPSLKSEIAGDVVFVGRSGFPHSESFFAGCSMKEEEYTLARNMMARGHKPDFAFWTDRERPRNLWPSSEVRCTGFKAEECGRLWRSSCIESLRNKVTVFGDDGWKEYLPDADIRSPVDYYTALPGIYREAHITLNMTSPLLPAGLTQRNFDVWAAGGFLLSDSSQGLDIFPRELTEYIHFDTVAQLNELVDKYLCAPKLRLEISKIWRNTILTRHTYDDRIKQILEFME